MWYRLSFFGCCCPISSITVDWDRSFAPLSGTGCSCRHQMHGDLALSTQLSFLEKPIGTATPEYPKHKYYTRQCPLQLYLQHLKLRSSLCLFLLARFLGSYLVSASVDLAPPNSCSFVIGISRRPNPIDSIPRSSFSTVTSVYCKTSASTASPSLSSSSSASVSVASSVSVVSSLEDDDGSSSSVIIPMTLLAKLAMSPTS